MLLCVVSCKKFNKMCSYDLKKALKFILYLDINKKTFLPDQQCMVMALWFSCILWYALMCFGVFSVTEALKNRLFQLNSKTTQIKIHLHFVHNIKWSINFYGNQHFLILCNMSLLFKIGISTKLRKSKSQKKVFHCRIWRSFESRNQ